MELIAYHFQTIENDFCPNPNYLPGNNTIWIDISECCSMILQSKPHFLDCNKSLLEAVEGITPPDKSVHDIVVDVT